MIQLVKGCTIRSIGAWRRNVSIAKIEAMAREKVLREMQLLEETNRQIAEEKDDRMRERQVAQAIVERSQEEAEHAKARFMEIEKRAREEQASESSKRMKNLTEELREEKDSRRKLEARLKNLEAKRSEGDEGMRFKLERLQAERDDLMQELAMYRKGQTPVNSPKSQKAPP